MNRPVILFSAAAVLLFSCSREAEQVIQPGETITFTAGWAGSEATRTILQEDGTSVWWESGAQINVFFSDKASGKFTSSNSQAQAIVDFQGSLPIVVESVETENPAHAYWAVYPYNEANTCDGESVTLTIPSTQTAAEGTFANKMFPSIATSTNFYLAFYNVCGGVRFTVANEGIASVTFKANNGESLTGTVKVGFDGVPVVESVVEGDSEVVVNAPTGGFVPGKYYFAALLPQILSKGVRLEFKKADGKMASTSLDNSITINRSRFGKMDEKDKGLLFGNDPTDIIVFADEKVKTRLVAKFDTNGDGELSYREAAAVTSIDGAITIKTVTSFDEFQYFTGITSIPTGCFKDWAQMKSISLPPSIIDIGDEAFSGCKALASVNIGGIMESIGKEAFRNCSSLTMLSLPNGVKSLGYSAFRGCSSLKSFVIPEGVTLIDDGTFMSCSELSLIVIPESVTKIGISSFQQCSNLTYVNIPQGVTKIGKSAFSYCSSLTSITIPKSVTSIGDYAFLQCSSLASILVDSNNTYYDSRDDCNAIIVTSSNTLIFGCKNTYIPESVTRIWEYAFSGCSDLVSLVISGNVTSIGDYAFSNCTNLTSIIIPESVESIGQYAFRDCHSLSSIEIPESVSVIKKYSFKNCSSLLSIDLPESITSIEENAFSNCTSLISIVIPESVMSFGEYAFANCSSLRSITVKPTTPPYGG